MTDQGVMDQGTNQQTLTSRREFLFCYDIRMGNPNGDPDENRPRVLPDGNHYVTDVRLKRFVRDYLKTQGHEILVDSIEGRTTNLTGRVGAYLKEKGQPEANGQELVKILLESFIDARMFGSTLAFKKGEEKEGGAQRNSKWVPVPKTLTGATQIEQGEVLHQAQEVDIRGTSILGSTEERTQGTFTENFVLRYGLVGFGGIANEHSAAISLLKDEDYAELLRALWKGVRSAGNTRTKAGQVPRLLVNVVYKPGSEFQLGRMLDYIELESVDLAKPQTSWTGPQDYTVNLSRLRNHLERYSHHVERIEWDRNADVQLTPDDENFFKANASLLDFDGLGENGR
jgi:CRISPR-associated protein Csh2